VTVLRRKPRYRPSIERFAARRWPERWKGKGAASRRVRVWTRRSEQSLGRALAVLVMPVLLMLGSVYVHTVAAAYSGEAARLEEEKAKVEDEGERFEVKITELSEAGRIRMLARDKLQMRDPDGKDLRIQGSEGGMLANDKAEKGKETAK
jgi:cell division protein FtsL